MPANECIPFKEPGSAITAIATAAVKGKRFVKITGPRTGGGGSGATGSLSGTAGLSDDVHNVYRAANCNVAGEASAGVAKHDEAEAGRFGIFAARRGTILPIVAGADINYGDEVMTDAEGRAIPKSEALSATKAEGSLGASTSKVRAVANTAGFEGNSLAMIFVNPNAASATLAVTLSGDDVIVSLGTSSLSAINSTAAEVIAAINASGAKTVVTADNGVTGKTEGAGVVAAGEVRLSGGSSTAGKALGYCMTEVESGKDAEIMLY